MSLTYLAETAEESSAYVSRLGILAADTPTSLLISLLSTSSRSRDIAC